MKDRFFKLDTESGTTTLNMADVSAYSVVLASQGILKSNIYDVEIHMKSGPIFTATMTESEMVVWEDVFFPNSVVKE